MKLPQESELSECIMGCSLERTDRWGLKEFVLDENQVRDCATKLLSMIMKLNLNDNSSEEAPDIDPNLVKIAELEAKIRVYESVIDSAGIKLGMPKKKTAIGFEVKK